MPIHLPSLREGGPAYLQVWRTKGEDELDGVLLLSIASLPASAGPLCVIYVKRIETAISVQTAEQSTTGANGKVPGPLACFPVTNWVLQRLYLICM